MTRVARLPRPRGEVSAVLVDALARPPADLPPGLTAGIGPGDPVHDEDLQLSLYLAYEPHYRGFAGMAEDWEWQPSLLALRSALEDRFEARLRELTPVPLEVQAEDVPRVLADLATTDAGPALAGFVQGRATLAQFREFLIHRSIYHLKEADPHTWAIPRLAGAAKAALVEIQFDEYGQGRPHRMHAELFRTTLTELGLDPDYGTHLDRVPAVTLATGNAMSLFGLHRRLRGAIAGHLAAFELTSSLPNRRYGNGLRRLGGGEAATRFFDEHVEADAVHEQIAAHDLCGRLVLEEPHLVPDVLFGAMACLALDREFAGYVLARWEAGRTSLLPP
jgi:hypothetical protein